MTRLLKKPLIKIEIESEDGKISVENGIELVNNLRKEADRQKAMKICEKLEIQTRQIKNVPYVPNQSAELKIAEMLEIEEEYDQVNLELEEE